MNNGGLAFPTFDSSGMTVHEGMSLRDYFAAAAISAIIAKLSPEWMRMKGWAAQELAPACYKIADALLAERERKT